MYLLNLYHYVYLSKQRDVGFLSSRGVDEGKREAGLLQLTYRQVRLSVEQLLPWVHSVRTGPPQSLTETNTKYMWKYLDISINERTRGVCSLFAKKPPTSLPKFQQLRQRGLTGCWGQVPSSTLCSKSSLRFVWTLARSMWEWQGAEDTLSKSTYTWRPCNPSWSFWKKTI